MSATTSTTTSSPSPSSPGFNFPKKETPNAHPYAIKTTSTALLSRSNSSSSHASFGPHHYVPTSPSPTSAHNSPVKHNRPSRHRYSRSLTSEAPQSLPAPPNTNMASSPSPIFSSEPEDEDNTPRRQGQRAETMPSSIGAPIQSLDLPDDPKTWTPSQLSTYLSSALRAGSANLPGPVAKDIARFVKQNRITGKVFLRLSEDDLVQFGINQLWRTTLLTSSRGLRQNILRGRIWGFGNTPTEHLNGEEEEEDPGNISSSSSNISSSGLNGVTLRRRSRHLSTASSSSESGRVRDMINSLERSSFDEEGSASESSGRLSTSPTKLDSFSSNHHEHRKHSSASPTKASRALPQRGAVNDLFGPLRSESEVAVDEKEGDATITNVARRNMLGREPRLLPFPPNQTGDGYHPSLSPSHTGAGYALPMSPEHTGANPYASPPFVASQPSDYELGFRPTPHSPHAQVYVVQHNPSPSDSLEAAVDGKNKGKRLLPYPPVTAAAQLHHPRPRRLVGTGGNGELGSEEETGYESGFEGQDGTTSATSATSGTEDYKSAFESQSESESVASNDTAHHFGQDDDDELSMQELLAGDLPTPGPTTGVDAWEMELGDTVKRIGGEIHPKVNGKNAGSVSEIGRKTGRSAMGTTGTRRKADAGKKNGLMGLFAPPEEEQPATETLKDTKAEEDQERARLLDQREEDLMLREREVLRREEAVGRREDAVGTQETVLHEKSASIDSLWSARTVEMDERDLHLEERERLLQAKEKALSLKEAETALKESQLLHQHQESDARSEELKQLEVQLREDRKRVEDKERMFDERAEAAGLDAALWPVPVGLLRKCWGTFVLPIVGEERTPSFLSNKPSSTSTSAPEVASTSEPSQRNGNGDLNPSRPAPYETAPRYIKKDVFFGGSRGGYLVLMSIGVCVVALRVLGRRAGGVIGRK